MSFFIPKVRQKRLIKKPLLWTLLLLSFWSAFPSNLQAGYKVKKPEKAVFASPEEERIYGLDQGQILTDGGYLKKGVWGKMEGVIDAPPLVVWRIFIQVNEWKKYGLPNLTDSRALPETLALQSAGLKKAADFYSIIGDRVFDATENEVTGHVWINYAFQYYNLPWPVADRWMVMKNVNNEKERDKGVFHCEWSKVGGNVNTINGNVLIEPFQGDPKRTRMEYYVESDPGSSIPKFLLKWGIKRTLPAAIKIIRREAQRVLTTPQPLLKTQ